MGNYPTSNRKSSRIGFPLHHNLVFWKFCKSWNLYHQHTVNSSWDYTMIYLILYLQSLFLAHNRSAIKMCSSKLNWISWDYLLTVKSFFFYSEAKVNIFCGSSKDVREAWGFCSILKCPWDSILFLTDTKLEHLLIKF